MRPDQIRAHIVRALRAVGYSQREAARMLAEHDAQVQREDAEFVEAMNEGCGRAGCMSCGTRQDVADELRRKADAPNAGRAAA